MNVEELLKTDRELTDAEFEFLEQELLKRTREFHETTMKIVRDVGKSHPFLARRLRKASRTLLENVEAAAAIPLHPPSRSDGGKA